MERPSVREFFAHKAVLLTGGTGFMGKVRIIIWNYENSSTGSIETVNYRMICENYLPNAVMITPIYLPFHSGQVIEPFSAAMICDCGGCNSVVYDDLREMIKVLIEKLLRTCPDIKTIYVISRAKKNMTPTTRILQMAELPLFQPLLETYPDALQKVIAVEGDLTKNGFCMINEARREIIENVEVFFHLGASLRLEANLKDAVAANIQGTQTTLDLAKQIKHLKAFVHVSTVFCQCEPDVVEEKIFKPPITPQAVIDITDWIKKSEQEELITKELLGSHPNCYTFTKQLAETLVDECKHILPVSIVRPAVVIPTCKEPIPGWVDSLNGPIGILVAGGKGVLRSMMCEGSNKAQVIPCDIAINAIILAAYKTALERNPNITPIYNASSGDFLPTTYGEILEKGMNTFFKYPLNPGLWYPSGTMTTNKYIHRTKVFLFQIIPALFIDMLLFIFGQKRFMMRIQNRIKVGCEVLQYFTMRNWEVEISNGAVLHDYLSKEEQQIFFLTNIDIDIDRMMEMAILGTKQYCLKEPLSTLPTARRLLKVYWVVDKIFKMFLLYHLYKLSVYLQVLLHEFDGNRFYAIVTTLRPIS